MESEILSLLVLLLCAACSGCPEQLWPVRQVESSTIQQHHHRSDSDVDWDKLRQTWKNMTSVHAAQLGYGSDSVADSDKFSFIQSSGNPSDPLTEYLASFSSIGADREAIRLIIENGLDGKSLLRMDLENDLRLLWSVRQVVAWQVSARLVPIAKRPS